MLKSLPHRSVWVETYETNLSLLKLVGAGLHYVDSHTYSWNSRTRTDSLCLLQYCVDGEGRLEFNNIEYPVLPGDAFVINVPGDSRYFLPRDSSHWEVLYLEFSKECLPLIWNIQQISGPVLHLANESKLVERMFALYKSVLNNELKTLFENSKVAYELWMDLAACAISQFDKEHSRLDRAKMYIDQNYYQETLSLDAVAEAAGLSKSSLSREFHRRYGISPGQYLKDLRIAQACRLLKTNVDYTIQDIARMVGYSNNNYFTKVFRAAKGVTPDVFRKQSAQYDVVQSLYETPSYIYTPDQEE